MPQLRSYDMPLRLYQLYLCLSTVQMVTWCVSPPFSHVCVWLCTCLSVFNRALSFSRSLPGAVPGDWSERVPREGPAGCVPHQGQQGPRCVPAGHGACQWEPHRGAGWHLTQPLQEVSDGGEAGGATSDGRGWICPPGYTRQSTERVVISFSVSLRRRMHLLMEEILDLVTV